MKDKKDVFTVEHGDQTYQFNAKHWKSYEEFLSDFKDVAQKCPRCDSCGRIIFPGSPVGKNGEKLMHLTLTCCPSAAFFAGHISDDGKLISSPKCGGYDNIISKAAGQSITFKESFSSK